MEYLKEKFDRLAQHREQWETTWDDVIEYITPNKPNVTGTIVPGEIRNTEVYDSTATRSVRRLAATLNGMLTNQSSQWFFLGIEDDEMSKDREVKKWLRSINELMFESFENSNFYTEIYELYNDLITIGTGVMFIDEIDDEDDKYLTFSTRHIGEIYIDEDDRGNVDTVGRLFELNARQMVQRFGEENVSSDVMEAYEDDDYDKTFKIVHLVFPREEYGQNPSSMKNMKYASFWFEYESENILTEEGYNYFPYVIVRWSKSSGEIYGRSPAIDNLPDIKTLNQMEYDNLLAGEKLADPPVLVPDEIFDTDFDAGGQTYYDPQLMGEPKPLFLGTQLPVTIEMANQKRDAIRDGFYVSQLQLIDHRNMTAEEVRIRHQENMRILGPTYGRIQFELMNPLISRVYAILSNAIKPVQVAGDEVQYIPLFPPAPESIQGLMIRPKYISPLAKAQRAAEIDSMMKVISTALTMAEASPEILDNIDFDAFIRRVSEIEGANTILMREERLVTKIREARYAAQAEQIQYEKAEKSAKIQNYQADAASKASKAQS